MGNCCGTEQDEVNWDKVAENHDAVVKDSKSSGYKKAYATLQELEKASPSALNSALQSIKVVSSSDQRVVAHHLKNVFAKPLKLVASYTPPSYEKTKQEEAFIETSMKKNFVFHEMSQHEERTLIKAFEKLAVAADSTIISQGDVGDYFYILESGRVRFEVNDHVVGHANPGDSFGELSLLYTSPRAATCVAQVNCKLWRLDQETFRYILQLQTVEADNRKRKILQGIDFLRELDDVDLAKLTKVLCPRPFSAGEHLVQKGEEGDVFYILAEGVVTVTDITVGDAHYEDRELGPGDYFGERALITLEPRAANIYGKTDGVCWTVDATTFTNVLGSLSQLVLKAQDKRFLGAVKCIVNTDLDSSELIAMADLIYDRKYDKGSKIAVEGKSTYATFYLVRDGKVQVTSTRHKEFQGTFTKGGYIGEDQLMADIDGDGGNTRIMAKYTVTVLEDATLGELSLLEARDVVDTTRIGHDKPRHVSAMDKDITLEALERHRILGAGTFGQVWLVTNKSKATYALKIQSKYELVQNEQAKSVVDEKNIMSRLNNQFIIKMVATFQDPSRIYILLKLVQGGELYSVLHDATHDGVPEASAKFYAAGILEGLSYMHRRNVCYRDLKPENVLIDRDGYPIIIDLGFAKVVNGKTFTLCGTPLYIAPEVILNRGHDKGADHWSLGVLIFEMITGYTPFYKDGMDQIGLFKAIIAGMFDFPSSGTMSSGAESIVDRLLVKDPHHRLGSLARGIKDIFRAPWFDDLSFEAYRKREIEAPWKPVIHDPLDTSNFDSWEHLQDKTKQEDPTLTPKAQAIFKGF